MKNMIIYSLFISSVTLVLHLIHPSIGNWYLAAIPLMLINTALLVLMIKKAFKTTKNFNNTEIGIMLGCSTFAFISVIVGEQNVCMFYEWMFIPSIALAIISSIFPVLTIMGGIFVVIRTAIEKWDSSFTDM